MVVDRQVHIFPADPTGLALADLAAGDPVADPIELAELLDVDVDDLARGGALIAADRLGRLESGKPIEAQPFEDAADGGRRNPDFRGDLLAGAPRLRKASTLSQAAGPVWLGDERGRDERSSSRPCPRRGTARPIWRRSSAWRGTRAPPPLSTSRPRSRCAPSPLDLWA